MIDLQQKRALFPEGTIDFTRHCALFPAYTACFTTTPTASIADSCAVFFCLMVLHPLLNGVRQKKKKAGAEELYEIENLTNMYVPSQENKMRGFLPGCCAVGIRYRSSYSLWCLNTWRFIIICILYCTKYRYFLV